MKVPVYNPELKVRDKRIIELILEGHSIVEVAAMYELSRDRVGQIWRRYRRRHGLPPLTERFRRA